MWGAITLAWGTAVATVLMTAAATAQPVLVSRALVLEGEAAPGTGGGSFSGFERLAANVDDDVVFVASVTGGTTPRGVFLKRFIDSTAVAIAVEGGTAPGTGGATFSFFSTPSIGDGGDVAFTASLSGGTVGSGIFRWSAASGLSAAVLAGDLAPGTGGGTLDFLFGPPSVNASGQLAFSANVFGGTIFSGVFLDEAGTLLPIALQGDPVGTTSAYEGFGNPALRDSGGAIFSGYLNGSLENGLFVDSASGGGSILELSGLFAPGGGTYSLFSFDPPGVSNLVFAYAFNAAVDGAPGSSRLFGNDGFGGTSVLVEDGDAAPDTGGGVFSNFPDNPDLHDLGVIVYRGSLTGGTATSGVFITLGTTQAVAVEGGPAPDTGGGVFTSFDLRPVWGQDDLLLHMIYQASVSGGTADSGIFFLPEPRLDLALLLGALALAAAAPRRARPRGRKFLASHASWLALTLIVLGSSTGPARAQPVVSASSDVTIDLGAGVVAADDDVSVDNQLGIVLLEGLGGLPSQADVVAYGQELGGAWLLSLDTTVDLGGLVARRGDVVRWNGQAYSIVFDASAEGVPANAVVDAVSLAPGGYLLSFDTTVDLGSGIVAHDEDLVRWSSTTGAFTIALSGASIGIPRALDVDGAQDLGGGAFLLSFDTAGTALGVTFDDDDVLRLEGGVLSVEFDGSAAHAAWGAADLDAVMVPEPGVATALVLGVQLLAGLGFGRRPRGALSVAGAALLAAGAAHAVDGVQEINQTCATQTGCFPGDTAGYPVTIDGSAGRSYRLTSDLVVPDENMDGISVGAASTSIDLNGFEIIRAACVGTTNCTPTVGTGSGVVVTSSGLVGVTVRDGAVSGMGFAGVFVGEFAVVRNVRAHRNRLDGIIVGWGSSVSGNTAFRNGGNGISTNAAAAVSNNTVFDNEIRGLFTGSGSTVSGNTAYSNGDDGILTGEGSTVSGNTAYSNGSDGIQTGSGCTVQRNTTRSNAGFGLRLGSQTAYRENVVTSNTAGTVTGGVNLFNNSCNGTTTCP